MPRACRPAAVLATPGHQRSFFGARIAPGERLQPAYGIFCMAMAFTDIGCRAIPHGELMFVHPVFFLMTLALVAAIAPRLARSA